MYHLCFGAVWHTARADVALLGGQNLRRLDLISWLQVSWAPQTNISTSGFLEIVCSFFYVIKSVFLIINMTTFSLNSGWLPFLFIFFAQRPPHSHDQTSVRLWHILPRCIVPPKTKPKVSIFQRSWTIDAAVFLILHRGVPVVTWPEHPFPGEVAEIKRIPALLP